MSEGKSPTAGRASPPRRRKSRKKTKAPTGLEKGSDGTEVGVDPRRLTTDDLRALGHRGKPLLQAMRRRCVDCCGGKTDEVRQCTAVSCPLWPYRMATDPWHPEAVAPRPETKPRPETNPRPVAEVPPPTAAPALAPEPEPKARPAASPAATTPKAAAQPVAAPEAKPAPKAAPAKRARSSANPSRAPSLPFMDIA